jgi:hypothetical protein
MNAKQIMTPEQQIETASTQLDRVLGFFARVDSKASFLFAFNATLLGVEAVNFQVSDIHVWYLVVPAALTVLLIVASVYFLYVCAFPHLKGGSQSLVYFREIAGRTEANFIDEFLKVSNAQFAKDLLGQVWRNSEILKIKFNAIKVAFIISIISMIPLLWCLVASSVIHPHIPLLK